MPAEAPVIAPPTAAADAPAAGDRRVGPYTSRAHRTRYLVVLGSLIVGAIAITALVLSWDNQFELFSERWWRVSNMRLTSVVVIALVTFCQSFATVTFQTATNNRIITPSIMGFESLYILIQTSIVYFLGAGGLVQFDEFARFVLQVVMMVLFAVLLYSWL